MQELGTSLLTLVSIFTDAVYGLILIIKAKLDRQYCILCYILPILLVILRSQLELAVY
ncbi:MAG: hypothetical protein V7K95_31640 [Nostoc sp.]